MSNHLSPKSNFPEKFGQLQFLCRLKGAIETRPGLAFKARPRSTRLAKILRLKTQEGAKVSWSTAPSNEAASLVEI